ncbi:hypothetical protein ACTNBM_13380 [Lachnospiraceae bacterium HCP1S3_C3]
MAIQFKEIRQYLARNARLSICFENGYYYDYLMVSDIPIERYGDLYLYGLGAATVEFSQDVYAPPKNLEEMAAFTKDDALKPAIEIVLHEAPRPIERKAESALLFGDIRPYLEIDRNYAIVKREDWSYKLYEHRNDISADYNDMFVYGVDMDGSYNKKMIIVLSATARADINTV